MQANQVSCIYDSFSECYFYQWVHFSKWWTTPGKVLSKTKYILTPFHNRTVFLGKKQQQFKTCKDKYQYNVLTRMSWINTWERMYEIALLSICKHSGGWLTRRHSEMARRLCLYIASPGMRQLEAQIATICGQFRYHERRCHQWQWFSMMGRMWAIPDKFLNIITCNIFSIYTVDIVPGKVSADQRYTQNTLCYM